MSIANMLTLLSILGSLWVGYLAWKPNKANSDANISELYTKEVAKNTSLNEKVLRLESMIYKAKDLDKLKEELEIFEKDKA